MTHCAATMCKKRIFSGLLFIALITGAFLNIPACPVHAAAAPDGSPDDFTVIMVGDILLHDGIEKCARQEDGSYDFTAIFAHTKDAIEDADLAIVNEEVIIGGEELGVTGYPSFNAPYEIADELAETGFDVICHATNHALDRGKSGIENCLSYWGENHPDIRTVGIYTDRADSEDICIFENDGYKIAVLNYTYGTNGIPLPKNMPYAVNLLDEKKVISDLAKAEIEADITIVCPHWGTEYDHGISAYQKKWAKIFAENGADIIIGTHPHVIEPVETIEGCDGRDVPVYYSIGNFINWTSGRGKGVADRMVGAMAEVTLTKDKDGEVIVKDYGVKPLVSHVRSMINGSTVYFLDDYTTAKSLLNEIRKRDEQFSYDYCESLSGQVFGKDLLR
ncbi:MAG: CapA family protein [Lachnospiraceae bacterium]|nr:CapA family protein [Lachnospiraceae bacterium]